MKKIIINVVMLSGLLCMSMNSNASVTRNFSLVGSLKNSFYYG